MGYIKDGLTLEAANYICIERCRAQCCQGPLILILSKKEKLIFTRTASDLGISLNMTSFGRSYLIKFEDHQGSRCPMLDSGTMKCMIYEDRPRQCRAFPVRPIKGCEISYD